MNYKVAGTVALLTGVLAVGTVDAQQRAPRPARPGVVVADSAGGRMQARRAEQNPDHPASAVLRLREQLQLTEVQVQRLEGLRQTALPTISEAAQMRARADLLDATKGDGNPDAARVALERMHRMQIDQQVARIRARKDAREVLTAQQKAQLEQMESRFVDRRNDRDGPNGRANARKSRSGQPPAFRGPGRTGPQRGFVTPRGARPPMQPGRPGMAPDHRQGMPPANPPRGMQGMSPRFDRR